jgi:hypothetical protein
VAVSGTGQSETPQSLATPAFAGFSPAAESGTKAALTTCLTTDRKIFDFSLRRGIMAEIEYPGIAKLVSRLVWDQETVRSSRTTRTKTPLKSLISEGFSYSLSIAAQFLSYSLQQNRPLSVVNPVGSTFNIQKSIPHKSLPSNIFPSCSINLTVL